MIALQYVNIFKLEQCHQVKSSGMLVYDERLGSSRNNPKVFIIALVLLFLGTYEYIIFIDAIFLSSHFLSYDPKHGID